MESEESKVLRAQVEVAQIRADIGKRIQEKEEEFENTRKNHQRVMESMQVDIGLVFGLVLVLDLANFRQYVGHSGI